MMIVDSTADNSLRVVKCVIEVRTAFNEVRKQWGAGRGEVRDGTVVQASLKEDAEALGEVGAVAVSGHQDISTLSRNFPVLVSPFLSPDDWA